MFRVSRKLPGLRAFFPFLFFLVFRGGGKASRLVKYLKKKEYFLHHGKVPHCRRGHRAGARCEPCAPCRHSALASCTGYRSGSIPRVIPRPVAGRRKRRAQRDLFSSSPQSGLADVSRDPHETACYFHVVEVFCCRCRSWFELCSRGTARYGRLSRHRGTPSGTIKRTACARAAGLDDSMRWTSVATS